MQILQVRLGTRSPSEPPNTLEDSADPLGLTRIGVAPASTPASPLHPGVSEPARGPPPEGGGFG